MSTGQGDGLDGEPAIEVGYVDRLAIQRWCAAVGETNPLYTDVAVAQEHGFRDVVMPPMFLQNVKSDVTDLAAVRPDGTTGPQGYEVEGLERRVHGGERTWFYRLVTAGETLTATRSLDSVTEKSGRTGRFVCLTWKVTYRDAAGEVVAKTLDTTIAR